MGFGTSAPRQAGTSRHPRAASLEARGRWVGKRVTVTDVDIDRLPEFITNRLRLSAARRFCRQVSLVAEHQGGQSVCGVDRRFAVACLRPKGLEGSVSRWLD